MMAVAILLGSLVYVFSGGASGASGPGVAPGCLVGIRPLKNREITPITASTESAARRPSSCEASFCLMTSLVTRGRHVRRLQLGLDVFVGNKRRAHCQVGAELCLHVLRYVVVVLNSGKKGGRQGRDQDGTCQRRSDRRAKLASPCSGAHPHRDSARWARTRR